MTTDLTEQTYSVELFHPHYTAFTFGVTASNANAAIRKARIMAEADTGLHGSYWTVGLISVK